MQDLSVRMSASGFCRTSSGLHPTCPIFIDLHAAGHFYRTSVSGPLAQISTTTAARSPYAGLLCKTTCARSLYEDLLSKISLS